MVQRPIAERVFPDRPDHAGRARDEERHPDRRVRQPAQTRRCAGRADRGARSRGRAPAADLDDNPGDDPRHRADRPRAGGRGGEPGIDGHRSDRWAGGGRWADVVCDPCDLRDGERAPHRRSRRARGGERRGVGEIAAVAEPGRVDRAKARRLPAGSCRESGDFPRTAADDFRRARGQAVWRDALGVTDR